MKAKLLTMVLSMIFVAVLSGIVMLIPSSGAQNATDIKLASSEARPTINLSAQDLKKESDPIPTADPTGPHPKLAFQALEHDFGIQMAGQDLTHSFVFKNDGNGLLIIDRVKAG